VQAATVDGGTLRPSLETTFHAVLGRVVLHTHPMYVNAFTCLAGGAGVLAEALGAEPVWVPYATPGYALGVAVDEAGKPADRRKGNSAEATFLASHGLIVAGPEAEGVVAMTGSMCALGARVFGDLPTGALDLGDPPAWLKRWAEALGAAMRRRGLLAERGVSRPARYEAVHKAASGPEQWLAAGPLVPDDVVYCGRWVGVAREDETPGGWLETVDQAEQIAGRLTVAVAGRGVVLAGPSEGFVSAMEENLLAHVLVRRLIARRGEALTLPAGEIEFLAGMEAERYRQAMAGAV
jgi:rhamnose utilization protein RhaD (predicted bifunctional aldolase and dehydrogenase)